ncbi:type 2 DNA topoisomerase 6 subunit B-like isoform X5 [Camelus ferus]|uniref:Type 2 DNA topoisomerase 6 subunit B-like isoform X5 n=2 Tax=Camelus TaxID=9836 RepID=A0A8B8TU56_CAMFR|nr:type 2 DNA topoisomerase 6 subunit B-like isoform X4 [Camelus dromedarius]XP_032345824.1 type 2 DNA topoisomerase 6 subunit B-like isoform X5 [Camelus ferus]XP_045373841.1 type 2 DNA topoisomerase 6 subunit B-like isoform X5 [Camelus bactrianus]
MEGTAAAICEILKYLIIRWKCETAEVSKGALLEGQLVISIEALNSKHQANTLHCVTTIASAGSIYGGLVLKKFLKEIQSILHGFSAKLNWTSEEASYSQDSSGVTPFQMIFEVDEKPKTLMTDSLIIKNFLHKIIIVLPKIRFNFSVKVNGIFSMEIFEAPKFGTTELLCSRIHPVLGHPVVLFIPDDVVGMGLLGELILTPAAALCPCPKVFSNQLNRISSVSIFLYGPLGLPLILPSQEKPTAAIFKDTSYFIDWKKYHLCVVPNLDLNLDRDLVLPDVSYQVESSEGDQSQNMDPQGQTLLLFLFVDFHSRFPVQQMELWGVQTLLTTHLSAIFMESHSAVQDSIQITVGQVLEQHHQAVKAHQKLQASLSVAVNSIMSIMTGSTSSSFRKICLQTLQATDTQEFRTKLHKSFHETTQHRFLHHCSCEVKQLLPERDDAEQSTEDAHENSSLELLAGTSGPVGNKRLKGSSLHQGVEETRAFRSTGALSPSEAARRRAEATVPPLTPSRSRTGPGSGLEDALWLQEVSNLSEWLSPGPGP